MIHGNNYSEKLVPAIRQAAEAVLAEIGLTEDIEEEMLVP
jgi:hypothetical protein